MPESELITRGTNGERALTAEQFQGLAEMPPELEWFANIKSEKTWAAYRDDVSDFARFVGVERPEHFRAVSRAHVRQKDEQARGEPQL